MCVGHLQNAAKTAKMFNSSDEEDMESAADKKTELTTATPVSTHIIHPAPLSHGNVSIHLIRLLSDLIRSYESLTAHHITTLYRMIISVRNDVIELLDLTFCSFYVLNI